MQSEAAHRRIRTALRAELKRRHGQIGQIEADLDRSEGYLSRFCRGDMELTLKGCLEVLEALEIEPGSFFSTTFGTVTRSEDILRTFEGQGPFDRGVSLFEQAAQDLEVNDVVVPSRRHHRVCAREFGHETVEVQLRRLRTGKKYRSEEFVQEYLEYLERARLDEPRPAARLAAGLATAVIPSLPLEAPGRAKWLCQAIEVYGSCLRALSEPHSAARIFRLGIYLGKRHKLAIETSCLLRRSAFVATDFGEFEKGIFLVREAQGIALEEGDTRNLGFTAITMATLDNLIGRVEQAERGFKRGLETLRLLEDAEARRWRVTAFSGLVHLFTKKGEIENALRWMSRATQEFRDEGGLILGKLLWQQGIIERSVGRFDQAIESLAASRKLLESGQRMDYALLSIDLASTLLEVGRRQDASEVAKGLAALTEEFGENKLAQTALVEFMRIVLRGGLSSDQLLSLKTSIESGHSRRSAPRTSTG